MKTCGMRSKHCDQYLSNNLEINDKQYPSCISKVTCKGHISFDSDGQSKLQEKLHLVNQIEKIPEMLMVN